MGNEIKIENLLGFTFKNVPFEVHEHEEENENANDHTKAKRKKALAQSACSHRNPMVLLLDIPHNLFHLLLKTRMFRRNHQMCLQEGQDPPLLTLKKNDLFNET